MSEPRARAAADDAAAAHDIAAEADRRGKSAAAFRTISEVSEEIDVPAHVLRFWETKFAQLAPMKRGGGRRYYRPADVALLKGVRRLLYEEGLTIKGLQKLLREKGVRHVAGLGEGVALELDPAPAFEGAEATGGLGAIIARLEAVRDRLREA